MAAAAWCDRTPIMVMGDAVEFRPRHFNGMNAQQLRIWLATAFFIAAVASISIVELARSYQTALNVAFTEADISGYLVSE
jgi:hypothetical protein